jgi:hypothetical protein
VSDEIEDLDEMLGFLGEEGRQRRDPEEHPSPEQLSAYQAGELTPAEDERIQDHLAVCGHCTELLLDLEELLGPPAATAEPAAADFEAAADWKRLRDHLPQPAKARSRKRFAQPLAASLVGALILLGLSSWRVISSQREVTELRSQVAELRQPLVNPHTISLRSVRGETFELPADRPVRLNLETSAPKEYGEYTIQIIDGEDKLIWANILHKDEHGKLTMTLIKGYLKPGLYTFRLGGVHAGSLDVLEEYLTRVTASSSRSQER